MITPKSMTAWKSKAAALGAVAAVFALAGPGKSGGHHAELME
jgi:hypothetical protein